MADTTTEPAPAGAQATRKLKSGKEDTKMAGKTDGEGAKTEGDAAAKGGGGRMKLIVAAVAVVAVLGGVWFFVLKPGGGEAKAAEKPKPVAGAVVKLDPITVNLSDGHFLKLGMSLQATADAGEEVSGAKALDAAIDLFSGKTVKELSAREGRKKAKEALVEKVSKLYEEKVYDIYLTDFVMQ